MMFFYAQLNDGSSVHKKADKFEISDNSLFVYQGNKLIAFLDLGVVLYAHLYEKGDKPYEKDCHDDL